MKVQFITMAAIISVSVALSGCTAKSGNEAQQPTAVQGSNQGTQPQGTTAIPSPSLVPTPTPASSGDSKSAATAAVDAEAIVKQSCIACHGDTLDGKGSDKKNLQKIGSRMNKEQIVQQITNGGGGMPGFKSKLKEEEIVAIAAWLEAKK